MNKILIILIALLFIGCDDKSSSSTVPTMHWDRDMCDRCVMVISDRKNSIQLRGKTKKQEHRFDDIGCMVIWIKESNINLDKLDIWVNDVQSGEWIDAKNAFYTSGNQTPMDYGFSAYKSKQNLPLDKDILSFKDVYEQIKK